MKKTLSFICLLMTMCIFTLCMICNATDATDGFEYFADESSYASHYYGGFSGMEILSEDSVRILANTYSTSKGYIGFMLKKEAIEAMVAENYVTVSFKITTQSYESGILPGYVNVYSSGVDVGNYQLSIENGTRVGNEDIYYASGSVVSIDLVKLLNDGNFKEGLKFILHLNAEHNTPINAPAYLILSDFQFTKNVIIDENVAKAIEWFSAESSYSSHHFGGFGGVEVVSGGSVRVLAKSCSTSNNHIGFMLKKEIIEAMVAENYSVLSFKIATEAYNSNPNPGFINVYASGIAGAEYQLTVNNGVAVGGDIDIVYQSGSVVEIDLVKLLSIKNFTEGLKFILPTAQASGKPASGPAYAVFSDFKLTKTVKTDENALAVIEKLSQASSYATHHYGGFGGVERISDGSVRVLAKTSSTSGGHVGFMIRKETIEFLVNENYTTLFFKITAQGYNSGTVPNYANIYASGIDVADYQLSYENGTRYGTEDIFYASGSVIGIDLVKLAQNSKFKEGLKFILKTVASSGNPLSSPAYLVLSDFVVTKKIAATSAFEQLTFEESYGNHSYGKFGGVTAVDEDSIKILANKNNGTSGFMLTRTAVENILKFRVTDMTVTLNTSAYNSGSVPEYVVLDSSASDYIENYETVVSKIENGKLYFEAGTEITIRLNKLYADITYEKGLNFTLLNGDSIASGSEAAYLTFDNIVFFEKWQNVEYDLVCTNGDFVGYYENEATWLLMTKKSIKAVADAGFDYIDLSLYRIRNDSDLMKAGWQEIIADLKAYADELGVEFRMAHSPGYTTNGSDEWVNTNKRCIDVCEMLGIKNLVVHPVGTNTKDLFFENNAKYYGYILPYAAEHDVNILCENSTGKNTGSAWFINDGSSMREFIKYVQNKGYSNFHGCWDTGHANCEGSQYLDIIALGDEMYAIHFHDNLGTDSHMVPYYGNMDIDEVMSALRIIGYTGDFTLETDGTYRIGSNYTGPELEGLNPFTSDRFEQQRIIYQIMTYILQKYDCEVLFEEVNPGFINVRAVTDIPSASIVIASYDGNKLTGATVIPKTFTMKNAIVSVPVNSGDRVFVLNDKMKPLAEVYTVE